MTYNRMEAKPIPGEYCRWCGADDVPLVKTPCCHQWICCDTETWSYRGGGFCQFQHENYSICHSHYNDGHSGDWRGCKACLDFWGKEDMDKFAVEYWNVPKYLNRRPEW